MKRRGFSQRIVGTSDRNRLDRRFRRLRGELLEDRIALAADFLMTGAGAGGGPHALARDPGTMSAEHSFFAYSPAFGGGVRVASGDVNGDGQADMITAPGAGGGPHVRVFDGRTGQILSEFFAFDPNYSGGVFVAAGDTNQDGRAEVIVSADGAGANGAVRVFNGANGALLASLAAPSGVFNTGTRVAAGDVNGDGRADIVLSASPGNAPRVMVLDATSGALLGDFFAYDPGFRGGIFVAAGDVGGDGRADIITGADFGGGPHVKVFDGATLQETRGFFAYHPNFIGGVRVATADYNGDGLADIVTGAGPSGGPHVRVFSGNNLQELNGFFAYHPNFSGGVFVAGSLVGAGALVTPPVNNPVPLPQGPVDLSGERFTVVDIARWGETLQVQATIRNDGPGSSGPFLVEWYLSQDTIGSSDDIVLSLRDGGFSYGHAPIAGNSIGPSFTTFIQLPGAAPPGFTGQNFHIIMRTDAGSQVAELNEANNFGEVGAGRDREAIDITVTPPPNLGYRIELFPIGMTPSQAAIFTNAANRWMQIVASDLPDIAIFGTIVDDLLIDAIALPIDGPGGILGAAGPAFLRTFHALLPIYGQMMFDTADLATLEADGRLEDVILHEMGHVLGIGTLWNLQGLILNSGFPDPRFRGAMATLEYNRIYGRNDTSVPIESFFTAGPGSAEGHWRESVFDTELMTPFAEAPGIPLPLSRVTAASLADLGYQVNMASPLINQFTPPPTATAFLTAPASGPVPLTAPPTGFLTDGTAGDAAFNQVRDLLRELRRSPGDTPVIELGMDVVEFLTMPQPRFALPATAVALAPSGPAQSITTEVKDELDVEVMPAARLAAAMAATPAPAARARATDAFFSREKAFAGDDSAELALLAERIGMLPDLDLPDVHPVKGE